MVEWGPVIGAASNFCWCGNYTVRENVATVSWALSRFRLADWLSFYFLCILSPLASGLNLNSIGRWVRTQNIELERGTNLESSATECGWRVSSLFASFLWETEEEVDERRNETDDDGYDDEEEETEEDERNEEET